MFLHNWHTVPPVNHLVASLEPAQSRHPPVRSGSVQVDNHVVLGNHQLQGADHIPAQGDAQQVMSQL